MSNIGQNLSLKNPFRVTSFKTVDVFGLYIVWNSNLMGVIEQGWGNLLIGDIHLKGQV